jgi:hypothetical protein
VAGRNRIQQLLRRLGRIVRQFGQDLPKLCAAARLGQYRPHGQRRKQKQ